MSVYLIISYKESTAVIAAALVSALIIITFCIIAAKEYSREKLREVRIRAIAIKEIYSILQSTQNFTADESYIAGNLAFIAVDENNRKILMGGLGDGTGKLVDYKIVEAGGIIGVELTEDGKGLFSSSVNTNTLGMAAIGGLLFGGAGAVVGAISGSNAKSEITEIGLRIALDIKTPYVRLNFISGVVGKGSNEHRQLLKVAQRWYGIVNIIFEREKKGNNT